MTTFAGSTLGYADGNGTNAQFYYPSGISIGPDGVIYVADTWNNRIRKITSSGVVSTIAGGVAGDLDGQGTAAKFNKPTDVAMDKNGNLYVADLFNNKIKKITPDGMVTTIAGSTAGYQDGQGLTAKFKGPGSLVVNANGTIYITESLDIRAIAPDGTVSTFAGSANSSGHTDGQGWLARFNGITGITIDQDGNLFVGDFVNTMIRKILPDGTVSTVSGSAFGHLDGAAAIARFATPSGVAVDSQGAIYVSDFGYEDAYGTFYAFIRKIGTDGNVSTIAGGVSGNKDGRGPAAQFSQPYDVVIDANGSLYVSDNYNCNIRKIVIK
ncbi:MAG TPA: hypothetical protein VKQ08_01175 [Cyclobacteriaceae bacterium]|nr:hypothetical protein [Cyclobacteriaceae bacterium]